MYRAAEKDERDVYPVPKLPDPPVRLCVWFSIPREGPLCDCEVEVVWDGEHAFLEVAKESTGFVDIATLLQTIYRISSAKERGRNQRSWLAYPKSTPEGGELLKERGARCEESL